MKVVIIGGAASGMTIASRIRKLSKETEVIVLQKEKYVSLGACGLPYFVANEDVSEDELLAENYRWICRAKYYNSSWKYCN